MPEDKGKIALYDEHNLAQCPWPQTPDGQYAQAFLTPLIQKGVSHYIQNIQTDLRVLVLDECVLPITLNEAQYDNSYVCSPYGFFIAYARQSLDFLKQAWLQKLVRGLLFGLGQAVRQFHVNKVITVNNWLCSTNLYPSLQPEQVTKIAQFLQQSFPDHALLFRCVDPQTNPICYQTLQQIGFKYIATRQIFLVDPHVSAVCESRLFKSDLKLLKNSGYEVVDGEQLTENDIPRLLELYNDLYIRKYSKLNPSFTADFLRLALEKKLLHFKALKKEGCIDGVVGYMQREGKMYCPFFGYDSQRPKDPSLYRLLSTLLMLEAHQHRLLFHQSSGASAFKTMRKAQGHIEYTAIFYKHLKVHRRFPWLMIKNLYNSVGKVYMKHY